MDAPRQLLEPLQQDAPSSLTLYIYTGPQMSPLGPVLLCTTPPARACSGHLMRA